MVYLPRILCVPVKNNKCHSCAHIRISSHDKESKIESLSTESKRKKRQVDTLGGSLVPSKRFFPLKDRKYKMYNRNISSNIVEILTNPSIINSIGKLAPFTDDVSFSKIPIIAHVSIDSLPEYNRSLLFFNKNGGVDDIEINNSVKLMAAS
ncbi:unnamed protein product [Gordionus sp. m RMFG-2023]